MGSMAKSVGREQLGGLSIDTGALLCDVEDSVAPQAGTRIGGASV